MVIKCPACNAEGEPIVKKQLSTGGWILFAALLIVCFPICWLPFVLEGTKETVTKCSGCGVKLPGA